MFRIARTTRYFYHWVVINIFYSVSNVVHKQYTRAIGRGGWRRRLGTATTVYVHNTIYI